MLYVCCAAVRGQLEQTKINWDGSAPASGLSMAWFYSAGIVFGVSAAVILAARPVSAPDRARSPRPT